jgi:hypothetical protein
MQVESVRAVLKKDLGLPLAEIADQNAKLDGGDVLFTGNYMIFTNHLEQNPKLFSIP